MEHAVKGQTVGAPSLIGHTIDEWLLRLRMSNTRCAHEMSCDMRTIATACGWATPADANAQDLTAYLLKPSIKTGKPLSSVRRCNLLSVVTTFMAYAVERGQADSNFAELIPRPKLVRGKGSRAMSEAEFVRLIAVAKQHEDTDGSCNGHKRSCVYLVAFYSGLRLNELREMRIRWVRLDADPPFFEVPGQISKSKRDETVPIHEAVIPTLLELMRERGPDDRLFRSMPGDGTFDKDLARAKIKKEDARGRSLSFHGLRKTFITTMAAHGAAPRAMQEAARHVNPSLTANVYCDAALLSVAAEVGKLPNLLNRVRLAIENGGSSGDSPRADSPMFTQSTIGTAATGSLPTGGSANSLSMEPVATRSNHLAGTPRVSFDAQGCDRVSLPNSPPQGVSTQPVPSLLAAFLEGVKAFAAALERGGGQ